MPAANESILETRNLSRQFGRLAALAEVSLRIEPYSVHSIIGPNGAGKTTLIKLLSGELAPSSGEIRFFDQSIARVPVQKRVGLGIARCFQVTSIFNTLTVLENVRLACQGRYRWRSLNMLAPVQRYAGMETKALAILDKVGLAWSKNRLAGEISYGQQRLLDVALALALEPKLLLLDEPAAGVGLDELPRMTALLQTLAQEYTIVLIEHNVELVMNISNTITVMQQGQVLLSAAPETVAADPRVQQAYLGGG
jgi:branched-chain amino acid transport system ATP-binding protein